MLDQFRQLSLPYCLKHIKYIHSHTNIKIVCVEENKHPSKEVMLIQSVLDRVVCTAVPCVGAVVLLSRDPNVRIKLNEFVRFTVSIPSTQQKKRHFWDFNILCSAILLSCSQQFMRLIFPSFAVVRLV